MGADLQCNTQIRELVPNLYSVHVRPREAMREYALMILKYETLYRLAFENAAARYFLTAAPSLAEIVMLGKVFWHASREMERGRLRWDMVVLDAPATGHGLTFLTVPEVFLRLVSEGPLARDMRIMQSVLADPARCSVCIVTLPEEMPANEAIDLDRAGVEFGNAPQGRAGFLIAARGAQGRSQQVENAGFVAIHFRGRGVTFVRIVGACFHQHVVELQQTFAIRARAQLRIDLRKIEPVDLPTTIGRFKPTASIAGIGVAAAVAPRNSTARPRIVR